MQFVRTEFLKPGMRLAKPIYNKSGVLLHERDSKLTDSAINSIHNFGLIGIYVLEPAEPLPPLSEEDIEFEKKQTVYVFQFKETIDSLLNGSLSEKFNPLVEDISLKFGTLKHMINFSQNMRSPDDYLYKHGVSIAILSAMITRVLNLNIRHQKTCVAAALLSNIGYNYVPKEILNKGAWLSENDKNTIQHAMEKGYELIRKYENKLLFPPDMTDLIEYYIYSSSTEHSKPQAYKTTELLSDVLKVANTFDQLTAMNINHMPLSEVTAMKFLYAERSKYNKKVVDALSKCIHIMPKGASVDLTTGDKAIVLEENHDDFMKPLILRLVDNQIYDLSDPKIYRYIQISDLMKTMDNRIKIDKETLKQFVPDPRIKALAAKFKKEKQNTQPA
ncbi:HD-GYP domain, c-di-GMP phosphodiesterase class II (or its inactivated variant) [Lachnospiraceae bacterium C7]|nr:HD-GYP domain, c-di-GMP phosphodiesterase class II (or its inactivated variant) [Lachnospiraceae bacterium C7]